jgi:hypothetical protein
MKDFDLKKYIAENKLNEALPKFLKGEAEKLDKEFTDLLNKSLKDGVSTIRLYELFEDLKKAIYNQAKGE